MHSHEMFGKEVGVSRHGQQHLDECLVVLVCSVRCDKPAQTNTCGGRDHTRAAGTTLQDQPTAAE
jgi:hypothetical protein